MDEEDMLKHIPLRGSWEILFPLPPEHFWTIDDLRLILGHAQNVLK